MKAAVLTAALWALTAGGVSADGASALRTLVTANDTKGWEAVGRLDIGTTGFCTGALIAPDVVLTAAHCLYDSETLEPVPLSEMEFLAGWRNGRATAYRRVRKAVAHHDYVYQGPEAGEHVAVDLALLQLDQPIRNTSVTPFETASRPRKGDEVGVVSYARDRATRPALQEVCHVLGRPAGTLVMSCDVDFGSSGAPVFSVQEGVPKIVSVISAKAELDGRPVSLGTRLDSHIDGLRTRLDQMRINEPSARTAKVRRLPQAGQSSAKFLRP